MWSVGRLWWDHLESVVSHKGLEEWVVAQGLPHPRGLLMGLCTAPPPTRTRTETEFYH